MEESENIVDTDERFVRSKLFAETNTYCQSVDAGAKLAAAMMVGKKNGRIDYVTNLAQRQGLSFIIFHGQYDHSTIYIYKYSFVKQLIEEIVEREKSRMKNDLDAKPSLLDVWTSGKLFGYSDYEIMRYLHEHGYTA